MTRQQSYTAQTVCLRRVATGGDKHGRPCKHVALGALFTATLAADAAADPCTRIHARVPWLAA